MFSMSSGKVLVNIFLTVSQIVFHNFETYIAGFGYRGVRSKGPAQWNIRSIKINSACRELLDNYKAVQSRLDLI